MAIRPIRPLQQFVGVSPCQLHHARGHDPLLYEAAQGMMTRVQKWSWLKAWTMNAAKRRGRQKAITALARQLAVIVHRMWIDETVFRWTKKAVQVAA
jgi:transposase